MKVGARVISGDNIIIATGSWPMRGDYDGSEYCISSNEVFELKSMPRKLVIIGGGYIGTELG